MIIPNDTQTSNLDDLEGEIKARLHKLDPIDSAAEMQVIQILYDITFEEYPDWTDDQRKLHIYNNWLGNNPL